MMCVTLGALDLFIASGSECSVHISCSDWTNEKLKYAKKSGDTWTIRRVDLDEDVCKYSAIALDANNVPHVSYYNNSEEDLKYATKSLIGKGMQY